MMFMMYPQENRSGCQGMSYGAEKTWWQNLIHYGDGSQRQLNGLQRTKNEKVDSLHVPAIKLYRVEAVGLSLYIYTFKITIFVNMWNLGQFRENLIFCLKLLYESSNLKFLLPICGTHNCDYLPYVTTRFYWINFQLNTDFTSQFCIFTVKSPSLTQRSVSPENAFKKGETDHFFFAKLYNSFTLIENNFRFLR